MNQTPHDMTKTTHDPKRDNTKKRSTMTTQTHTIILESPKQAAATAAAAHLSALQSRTEELKQMAIEGTLSAATLAAHTDELNVAQIRADALQADATTEMQTLGSTPELTAAFEEFFNDNALNTDQVEAAIKDFMAAHRAVATAITTRNQAIKDWTRRLTALGVPREGLTYDGRSITVDSSSSPRIVFDRAGVTPTPAILDKLTGITEIAKFNAAAGDQRSRAKEELAVIKLTTAISGYNAGDELTSRTHLPSSLAQLVASGNAEHVSGELPQPNTSTRTFVPPVPFPDAAERGRAKAEENRQALRRIDETTTVNDAVSAAFNR